VSSTLILLASCVEQHKSDDFDGRQSSFVWGQSSDIETIVVFYDWLLELNLEIASS